VERPVGVIVADIDRFKMINDEHGHGRGDAVLVDVAYELRKALRAFDLSYRIGGEEFLMLLPGADADQAEAIGDALRDAIERTPVAGGLHVTASFGVAASAPGEAFDYERTFDRADAALLAAKREGRNCVRVATSRRATASAAPALRAAGASAG
jgi:diguanylate cyclase (GGDEF)-like protein